MKVFKILIIAAFLISASSSTVFCEDNKPSGPRISLPKTTIELGSILQGETAQGEFTIGNQGDAPLNILEIKTSCGCTAATPNKQVIEPGKQIQVKVSVDTKEKTGIVKNEVEIKTNDPQRPKVSVKILTKVLLPEHLKAEKGQSIFTAECIACHAKPTAGKSDQVLFETICAICHGHYGLGNSAPRINDLDYLAQHEESYLKEVIREGKAGTSMPGFAKSKGGPLDDAQVDSLIKLMLWWKEGRVFKR